MKLVHLFNVKARVEAPIEVGKGLTGTRRIFSVTGGEFEGPHLRGTVLPVGGEWFLQGEGSVGQPDVRLLLQTEGGDHVYMRYSGVLDFNEKVIAAITAGRATEFGDTTFLTQVRFEAGAEALAWLNTTIAVGEGRMHPDCVEYAIYQATHG